MPHTESTLILPPMRHAWPSGVCVGRGCTWQGHAWQWGCAWPGGHAWQERLPLQREVCILLECILVELCLKIYDLWRHHSPTDRWLDGLIGRFMSNH